VTSTYDAFTMGAQFDEYRRDRDRRRAEVVAKAAERARRGRFMNPQLHAIMKAAGAEAGRRFDEKEPEPASIGEWRSRKRRRHG
jgi:hypothetical protein